jgi:predicted MFS family arabinose efflux permease
VTITPRLAITLTFIAFGVMAGLQVGAIPVLRAQSSIDSMAFGILSGLSTAASILAMGFAGALSRRYDHRSVILFILPLSFVLLLASLLSHSMVAFGISFIIFNYCLGTLDLFMNAEGSIVEQNLKTPVFASFHAAVLYAIGLSGLAGGYISVTWGPAWAAVMSLPFLGLATWSVHTAIPHHHAAVEERRTAAPLPRKMLVLIGVMIGLDVAAELACITWSGQLLAGMQPQLAQYSGLGIAFYGLCNGTVRLFGDRLRTRFTDMQLVAVSLCVGVAGFVILATSPGFAVSVLAFAVVGAGLALIFPCLTSVAANLAPQSRAAALGLASMVSGPPRILLPVAMGLLAQNFGMYAIYMAAGLACVCALCMSVWTGREMAARRLAASR